MTTTTPEHASNTPNRGLLDTIRDYIALTKPNINQMCVLMTLGGIFLARHALGDQVSVGMGQALLGLAGATLSVAAALAFNMWYERDTDRHMERTKGRPLADGRISAKGAFIFSTMVGLLAFLLLYYATNTATILVAFLSLISYTVIYTPMKYMHPLALFVGALPGAAPPLMGWTIVTGGFELPGLILFAILLVWQMPHFIAISTFRRTDYAAAGIRTVPGVRGMKVAKRQLLAWALLLVPTSLSLAWTDAAGLAYGLTVAIANIVFFAVIFRGIRDNSTEGENRWARRVFLASVIYLPTLIVALALDIFFA